MKENSKPDERIVNAKNEIKRQLEDARKAITEQPLSMQMNLKGKFKIDNIESESKYSDDEYINSIIKCIKIVRDINDTSR